MSTLPSTSVPLHPHTTHRNGSETVGSITLSENTLQRLTVFFGLLSDKSRLRMVLALAEAGEMHVTALCGLLKQSQPAVSHHLTLMRAVGLVSVDRRGKHNFYSLASDHLRELLQQVFGGDGSTPKELRFREWVLAFEQRKQ